MNVMRLFWGTVLLWTLCVGVRAEELTYFVWSGGVSSSAASVVVRTREPSADVRLQLATTPEFKESISTEAQPATGHNLVRFSLQNLTPDSSYRYRVLVNGVADDQVGQFRTHPKGGFDFTFAFSACAGKPGGKKGGGGSNHVVFEEIRQHQPLFYLNTGDLHYADIAVNDPSAFRAAYDSLFSSPRQRQLYASTPLVHMWDDHDFGPNNSDRHSPSREAALQVYREYIPHYDLAAGHDAGPVYQAFSVGRVRFLLTDLRSEKSAKDTTMMGEKQKAWFKEELRRSSKSHALVIWVTTVPWIAKVTPGADHWGGFAEERSELANWIHEHGITNLLALSGDAHMVALDDGSNNTFNAAKEKGFPVFHAAALDRSGSVKRGPYSHGTFPGGGQFGLVKIQDHGNMGLTVTCIGLGKENNELLRYTFSLE